MRHQPKPDPSFLQALLAAVPDKALRPLVLELLTNGAIAGMPSAPAGPESARRRKRRGRPPGRKRRGPGRPRKEIDPDVDAKILARRKREAQRQRDKRAAAKRAATASKTGNGGQAPKPKKVDPKLLARRQRAVAYQRKKRAAAKLAKAGGGAHGNGAGTDASGTKSPASRTPTQAFWQHAEMLQPTAPYKAVASEFGLNPAQTKDCYRKATLPPALTSSMVEKFLELPAT